VLVGPVLEELGAGSDLVMIPGGLLGLLPLHAAWRADPATPTGRRYALDDAVWSYAPNGRALSAARELAAAPSSARALVIVDPQPVSAPGLRWAGFEGLVAAAASPGPATVLRAGEATAAAFAREAGDAALVHLACHGVADLDAPLESGLLMAGNQWVTLRDLLARKLRVRLAVLSACETSLPGTDLPDEVVALPTGLLQAGVAGVIASQWAVPDLATAILMTEFYGRLRSNAPAAALRDAQKWVRDTTNGEKVEAWQRAVGEREDWLPDEVAEALIDRLAFREPDARDEAKIRAWGAFTHVGV
jgi:CHAT domain-containing protein